MAVFFGANMYCATYDIVVLAISPTFKIILDGLSVIWKEKYTTFATFFKGPIQGYGFIYFLTGVVIYKAKAYFFYGWIG